MELKVLQVENLEIAYAEQNPGAANTIVFIHGNSVSSKTWRKQFENPLLKDYRLIAFDLPNHGDSSGIPEIEQITERFFRFLAEVMTKAIQALIPDKKYILTAYSFGTNIIAQMLNSPSGSAGIVFTACDITGTGFPPDKVFLPDAPTEVFIKDQLTENEVRQWFAANAPLVEKADVEEIVPDFLKVKIPLRSTFLNYLIKGEKVDEVGLVKSYNKPVLIIFGRQEQAININYLNSAGLNLWKKSLQIIDGGLHFVHIEQPEKVSALIAEYASEVFGENGS